MSTIETINLTKRFGDMLAVSGVDLDIAAGEVLCLLGPSGCGKTTTLRMIAGLETTTETARPLATIPAAKAPVIENLPFIETSSSQLEIWRRPPAA